MLHDAALVVEDGRIAWLGAAWSVPAADTTTDLGGRAVLPGFVDSHTHLVFAGDRGAEFEARMRGARYDGGGIASTVRATRAATDEELRSLLRIRIAELRAQGTTTVEVKSGYGLDRRAGTTGVATRPRGHGRDDVPRRARRPAGRRARGVRAHGDRSDARRPVRRSRAGWTSSANRPARTRSTATRHARSSPRAAPRDLGLRVHGNQLAEGPGVAPRRRVRRRERRPLHVPRPTPTSTRSPAARRWRRCCRASSSRRATRTRTPAGCSTPE